MSAAPAYSRMRPERQPQRAPRPRVRAIPGGGARVQEKGVSSQVMFFAKVAVAALALITAVCCVRVALSAATVSTAVETQELNQQIAAAREQGNALEVSHSTLSNPTHVKAAATELGMVAPATTETIDVGADIVAVDDAGNLSLTQSLERVGSQAE